MKEDNDPKFFLSLYIEAVKKYAAKKEAEKAQDWKSWKKEENER